MDNGGKIATRTREKEKLSLTLTIAISISPTQSRMKKERQELKKVKRGEKRHCNQYIAVWLKEGKRVLEHLPFEFSPSRELDDLVFFVLSGGSWLVVVKWCYRRQVLFFHKCRKTFFQNRQTKDVEKENEDMQNTRYCEVAETKRVQVNQRCVKSFSNLDKYGNMYSNMNVDASSFRCSNLYVWLLSQYIPRTLVWGKRTDVISF